MSRLPRLPVSTKTRCGGRSWGVRGGGGGGGGGGGVVDFFM